MPKHNKSRSSIYSIEKRLTIVLLVIILLMFAFTPFVIIFNRRNNENGIDSTELLGGINNEHANKNFEFNDQKTSEVINQTLSSSNSDILTSSKPILNNVVDAAKSSTINAIQNLKLPI